jgi:cell fate regulator YaaT (PSP1 superfamily)
MKNQCIFTRFFGLNFFNMSDDISRGCPIKSIDPEATNCRIIYSGKLNVFDWLKDIPEGIDKNEIYEVRFKNTRKGYYYNQNGLRLTTGDIVAVEASPGHDIGIISLRGPLVLCQLRKHNINPQNEFKTIYRKVKPIDIEKWKEAIALETSTMIESRKIAADLKLDMKIGDVEYQGDKTKAIFYYIADDRVDFRQLIKVLAERFHIRVEMRQIGARQEAGRIGGIGSCGRELCCSTWMTNFVSVTTTAARYQELSPNPQKLAGQCCKLKCCLNYEVDSYIDERKDFPPSDVPLLTETGKAYYQKTDVFRRVMWYSVGDANSLDLIPISVEKVKEYIQMNKRGQKVQLEASVNESESEEESIDFSQVVGQDSLTRFDSSKRKKKKHKSGRDRNNNQQRPHGGRNPRNNQRNEAGNNDSGDSN